MNGNTARKLRLHPVPDDDPVIKNKPDGRRAVEFRVLVWVLAVGIALGASGQVFFSCLRYYRAEARIVLKGAGEAAGSPALRKHLVGLLACDSSVETGDGRATIPDLMRSGRLVIYPSDRQTISLVVSGANREEAYRTADDLTAAYLTYAANPANGKATQRDNILNQYRQLQKEHEQLTLAIHNARQDLPSEQIDAVLAKVAQRIEGRIKESEGLVDRLDRTNKAIAALRDELLHPTLKLDPQRWNQIRGSDRLYSGDLNVLKGKHADYMAGLQMDMKGLTGALEQLQALLKSIAAAISKQLQMKLPEDLSDDLLEMNLAVEKYQGQLAHFQERWERYQAKLLELLADPTAADFDGIGTLLSQLRQDLLQRCAQLPAHLDGLYGQLRQGNAANPDQPGKLSGLTARSVAASALAPNLEQVQDAWRKVSFHLNRLFPDGNVRLLTLGRVCRSLQWRLSFREKQLKQMIEQQQLAAQRRETQARLVGLQKEFETTSGGLVALYRQFAGDQRQLADLTRRWPSLQRLQESIRANESRQAAMEKDLAGEAAAVSSERLETRPIIVRVCSYAGINPRWESPASILLALVGMVVTLVLLRPEILAALLTRNRLAR